MTLIINRKKRGSFCTVHIPGHFNFITGHHVIVDEQSLQLRYALSRDDYVTKSLRIFEAELWINSKKMPIVGIFVGFDVR